jgi:hypothetical protein
MICGKNRRGKPSMAAHFDRTKSRVSLECASTADEIVDVTALTIV